MEPWKPLSFKEFDALEKEPLDRKVERAVAVIREAVNLSKHQMAVAFSGGKDSTVLLHLMTRHFPELRPWVIFANTGIEYPESLRFARQMGKELAGERYVEALPDKLEEDGLKYQAQKEVLEWLVRAGRVSEVLKEDGKLKSTRALEQAATPEMWEDFRRRNLVWRKGMRKSFWWCCDQYGFPLLGKSKSKLDARRINIDCFLRFSASESESPELLEYYRLLRNVKISQHCCKELKKAPSERAQAEHDVDVIFKGLMGTESRTRKISFITRGYIIQSHREHLPSTDPFARLPHGHLDRRGRMGVHQGVSGAVQSPVRHGLQRQPRHGAQDCPERVHGMRHGHCLCGQQHRHAATDAPQGMGSGDAGGHGGTAADAAAVPGGRLHEPAGPDAGGGRDGDAALRL